LEFLGSGSSRQFQIKDEFNQRQRREMWQPGVSATRSGARHPWIEPPILSRALRAQHDHRSHSTDVEIIAPHTALPALERSIRSLPMGFTPGCYMPFRWRLPLGWRSSSCATYACAV